MLNLEDIYSLTDFQRNTKEWESRKVMLDASSYQRVLRLIERLKAIERIRT